MFTCPSRNRIRRHRFRTGFTLVTLVAIILTANAYAELPPALGKMLDARQQLRSGDVEWSLIRGGGSVAGIELFFDTRYATNGDRIEAERGDFKGQLPYTNEDGVRAYIDKGLRSILYSADGGGYDISTGDPYFEGFDAEQVGTLYSPSFRGDARKLGLGLSFRVGDDWEDAIWSGVDLDYTGAPLRFTQRKQGENVVVTAEFETKQSVSWQINPERGWNAERIWFTNFDGSVPMDVTVQLQKLGKTWFPQTVDYWVQGELSAGVRVVRAAFNSPADAKRFGPGDIGAEPGMRVGRAGATQLISTQPIWDGKKPIPKHEWEDLVRRGERKPGPTVRAWQAAVAGGPKQKIPIEELRRAYTLQSVVTMRLNIWRQYTNRVIWAYRLNKEQTQQARLMLAQAEQDAETKFAARKARFAELENLLKEAKKHIADATADAIWERLDTQVRKELGFLTQIFEDQLVPQLDRIPTRGQRAKALAAGRAPTQQR